jgi:MFS family permease
VPFESSSAAATGKPSVPRFRHWQYIGLAYTLGLVLVGANIPTPLYRIYQQIYGFSTAVLTVIFVAYVAGVILGLVVAGGASDRLGRKALLVPAVVAGICSGVAFAAASGVGWLVAGRALAGVSTGIVTSVIPAALVDYEPHGRPSKAALVASAVTVGGLACGPLVSALLVQYAPWPTTSVYVLYVLASVPSVAVIAALPYSRHQRQSGWLSALRPRRLELSGKARAAFRRATVAFVPGWVGTALFFSLGPTLSAKVLHTTNIVSISGVVLEVFAVSAVIQLLSRNANTRLATLGGLALFACGLGLVPLSVANTSPALLVGASFAVGAGQGLSHRATQDEVTRNAPTAIRGQTVAVFFIAGYLAVGTLIPTLGVVIDGSGLVRGLSAFALVVSLLAVTGFAMHLPDHDL